MLDHWVSFHPLCTTAHAGWAKIPRSCSELFGAVLCPRYIMTAAQHTCRVSHKCWTPIPVRIVLALDSHDRHLCYQQRVHTVSRTEIWTTASRSLLGAMPHNFFKDCLCIKHSCCAGLSGVFVAFNTLGVMEQAQCTKIATLLGVGIRPATIAEQIEYSRTTVYAFKKKLAATGSSARVVNTASAPKKGDTTFLTNLSVKVDEKPTRSVRKLAQDTEVDEGTIRGAIKDFGLKFYTSKVKRLLTIARKPNGAEKGKERFTWIQVSRNRFKVLTLASRYKFSTLLTTVPARQKVSVSIQGGLQQLT